MESRKFFELSPDELEGVSGGAWNWPAPRD